MLLCKTDANDVTALLELKFQTPQAAIACRTTILAPHLNDKPLMLRDRLQEVDLEVNIPW